MAAKKHLYCVQFIQLKGERDGAGLLIEQLRYSGVISVVREADEHYVLRVYPPAAIGVPHTWADQNASRMRSFGINAEVVRLP